MPSKISSYMRATRAGVSIKPSRSGSSPIASRISRTARSMRGLSTAPGNGNREIGVGSLTVRSVSELGARPARGAEAA